MVYVSLNKNKKKNIYKIIYISLNNEDHSDTLINSIFAHISLIKTDK